jgi:Phosphoesterase family
MPTNPYDFGKTLSLISLNCALLVCVCLTASAQVVPLAQHVVLVVEENTSFGTAYPNGMPWLVSQGNKYAYANNYSSDIGGSLLDYLYLSSGSCESDQCGLAPGCSLPAGGHNFYCSGDSCYLANSCVSSATKDPITDENIFHLMNNQPISWRVYAQNYLNAGGNVNVPDFTSADQPPDTHYYARHNAAVWYDEVLSNTLGSQGNIVDFEQFGQDVAQGTLPRFSIIVPDGCWDAHDVCISSPLTAADVFLQSNLAPMLKLPDFKAGGSGLLFVTFDNGDGDAPGKVYTAVIGPNVRPGYVSNVAYRHENMLRTMLDALGIETYPGWSASVPDMSDLFSARAGGIVINAPVNKSNQGASVLVNAAASELGAAIDHMEVWDKFDGQSTKLGDVFGKTINQVFAVTGKGAHQMTVEDVGGAPNYPVLHKATTSYTVSSTYGVFISTPARNSTQATLFPLKANAVEAGAGQSSSIDHIEVWNGSAKIGDSPKGASLSQWYALAPGKYTLTVRDVSSTGATLHQKQVSFTVASGTGVYLNSPTSNSSLASLSVPINAYAYEQNGASTPLVDHIEVWDNTHGVKLGESVTGVGVNSAFINQTVKLPKSGAYQLAIEDIDPNNGYRPIHTSYVNIFIK